MELFYRIRTEAHLTAVLLALRLHLADHGHFPKTLGALTPTYLASVPNDPLARSAPPLHFIFDDVDPRVYSVGLDAVDDGGNEAPYHPERRDPHWDSPDLVYHYVRQPRPNYEAMYEPQQGALGPAVPLTPAPDAPSSAP